MKGGNEIGITYTFDLDSPDDFGKLFSEVFQSVLIRDEEYDRTVTPGASWSFHTSSELHNEVVGEEAGIQSQQYIAMDIDKFDLRSSGYEFARSVLWYFLTQTKFDFFMRYNGKPLILRRNGFVQIQPGAAELKPLHLDESYFETMEHLPCFRAFSP